MQCLACGKTVRPAGFCHKRAHLLRRDAAGAASAAAQPTLGILRSTGRVVTVRVSSPEKRLNPRSEAICVTRIIGLSAFPGIFLSQPVGILVGFLFFLAHHVGIGPRGIVAVVITLDEGLFPLRIVLAFVAGIGAALPRLEVFGAKVVAPVVRAFLVA